MIIFSRFDTIHANADGQTDRQTDGDRLTAGTALCIASRGKKETLIQWCRRLTCVNRCIGRHGNKRRSVRAVEVGLKKYTF